MAVLHGSKTDGHCYIRAKIGSATITYKYVSPEALEFLAEKGVRIVDGQSFDNRLLDMLRANRWIATDNSGLSDNISLPVRVAPPSKPPVRVAPSGGWKAPWDLIAQFDRDNARHLAEQKESRAGIKAFLIFCLIILGIIILL